MAATVGRRDPGPVNVEMGVRRVQPEDWPELRALRLQALADVPIAYLESLADARAHDEDEWRSRARRGAVGGDSFQVVAVRGDRFVGTMVGFPDPSGQATLAAVYLAPEQRGTGLAERLLDAVAEWARGAGFDRLMLMVHEHNDRARAFYRRLGFVETGSSMPYVLDPSAVEIEMGLSLRATQPA